MRSCLVMHIVIYTLYTYETVCILACPHQCTDVYILNKKDWLYKKKKKRGCEINYTCARG